MNYFRFTVKKDNNKVVFEVYDDFGDRWGTNSFDGKNTNEAINKIITFGNEQAPELLYEFFDEKIINYKGFQIILHEMEAGPN